MDSYFATVEQQENPYLRAKPVGVIKAVGRTCVIAASKEAKKYGVKTGMPLSDVRRLCPKIILVPTDMEKYFYVTKRFADICRRYTPLVEMFSIDELFMDVTSSEHLFGGAVIVALEIKQQIKKEIGDWLSCSVGISYNKFLAKLASKKNKPDGLFVITPENKDDILLSTELVEVCGIGRRLEKRLSSMGVRNFSQLRQLPDSTVQAQLGSHWPAVLRRMAYGDLEDINSVSYNKKDSVITPDQISAQKSVSRTYTLFADTYNLRVINQYIRNLSEETAWKLRRMKLVGRLIGLSIRGADQGAWNHKTFKIPTADGLLIAKVCEQLFKSLNWPNPVRFVGIYVSLLSPNSQTSLLPKDQKRHEILKTMDYVNDKFGQFTLYPAQLVDGEQVKPEVNGFLGDKGFRILHQ
ncbi:MAG: polymerase IV protein [Microgenomates group bacterium GW2011_GWA2_44_7]|nr:MAG: polymerase IV protein [Microgenomates group bacterium GW2011_GWA2_44_7]